MAERAHPTPAMYWLIAIILTAVTAVEIGVTYVDALDPVIVPLLIVLGAVKFGAVVAFFMHLRFDKPIYRNLFLVGLFGAIPIFLVVLLTFAAL